MEVSVPSIDIADILREEGGEAFLLCYQCGTCTAVCPWRDFRAFNPRFLIHQARLGLVNFESDDIWDLRYLFPVRRPLSAWRGHYLHYAGLASGDQ